MNKVIKISTQIDQNTGQGIVSIPSDVLTILLTTLLNFPLI